MAAVQKARAMVLMKMDDVEAWLDSSEEGDIEVYNADEQLIIQVQSYPLIWDTTRKDYQNKTKRDAYWSAIALQLKQTG